MSLTEQRLWRPSERVAMWGDTDGGPPANQTAYNCLKYLQKFNLPVAALGYVSSDY